MLDVCLLGCGGMLPLPKRYLTSMILRNQGSNILVDCGEGNQVALYQSAFSLKQDVYKRQVLGQRGLNLVDFIWVVPAARIDAPGNLV